VAGGDDAGPQNQVYWGANVAADQGGVLQAPNIFWLCLCRACKVRTLDNARVCTQCALRCADLYSLLYQLANVTGDAKHAAAADAALTWFASNCSVARSGLFAWGKHAQWDFRTESYAIGRVPRVLLLPAASHQNPHSAKPRREIGMLDECLRTLGTPASTSYGPGRDAS
jgi:hypothetical protein